MPSVRSDLVNIRKLTVYAAITLSMLARLTIADGIVFRVGETAQLADVGHQRAVVWQREDAFELIIEPVFYWDNGTPGVWVIPLPALPEVGTGDPAFLDDLEIATAPRFIDVCIEPSCCCNSRYCDGETAGATTVRDIKDSVTVWSSGTVGSFDYAVLSASNGETLVAWLDSNGFSLPKKLEDAVSSYETQGIYWFVAKVKSEAGRALTPVSFRFSPTVAPFYPARLTLVAMAEGDQLEVHIFTIGKEPLVPTEWIDAGAVTGFEAAYESPYSGGPICLGYYHVQEATPDAYVEKVSSYLQKQGGFVVEAAGPLAQSPAYGPGNPEPTSAKMRELLGTPANVARIWGVLEQTGDDISFGPIDNKEWQSRPFPKWCNIVGLCHSCPPCPEVESDLFSSEYEAEELQTVSEGQAPESCSTTPSGSFAVLLLFITGAVLSRRKCC